MLSPAESTVISPAIYDTNDLARVTGFGAESTREIEWRRILGGILEYRPSVAYQLRDAILSNGYVILPQSVRAVIAGPRPLWGRYDETEPEQSLLTATFNSSRFFGHWLFDELTRILAAPRVGPAVAPPRPMTAHQREYLVILGLEQRERTDVRFRQLVLFDERNQNAYRRERYEVLRTRVRRGRESGGSEGVMLLRKQTGVARILVNEEELAQRLGRRGFKAMCPAEHSVEEILHACIDAKVVVGVEGSQMMHALLAMRTGGTFLTLQPPYQFNNILKTYCDGLGLRYAFVIGHARPDGFFIEPGALDRLLDRVSAP